MPRSKDWGVGRTNEEILSEDAVHVPMGFKDRLSFTYDNASSCTPVNTCGYFSDVALRRSSLKMLIPCEVEQEESSASELSVSAPVVRR